MRKVIFGVSVAVVACLGVWILLTPSFETSDTPTLSAVGASPDAGVFYTVVLREFSSSEKPMVQRIVEAEALRRLADDCEFRFVDLADGRIALCVGRSETERAGELHRLVDRFQSFETASGSRPFRSASIQGCPE